MTQHTTHSSTHPSPGFWSRVVRLASWLAAVLAAVLVGLTVNTQIRSGREFERDARGSARTQALAAVKVIEDELRRVMPAANALAADLSSGRLAKKDIVPRLTADLTAHPTLFEIGVAYQPYAADAGVKLFAPHVNRAKGTFETLQIEQRYDYTTYDWYKGGLVGAGWGEPYFGAATGALVVGYNVPFYRPGDTKTPIGVARVNFSLEGIRTMISRVSLGQTGYGFLLSKKGLYLSHPDEDYVRRQRSAFDVAKELHETKRLPLYERGLRGEASEDLTASDDGRLVWLVQEPIKATSWVFGVEFFADEVQIDAREVRRGSVKIACASLMLLFAGSLLAFRVERGGHRELWAASMALGILLLGGISATWMLTMRFPDRNGETSVHILDWGALQKFISAHTQGRDEGRPEPLQIGTGVLVRTMRLIDANDIVITGTVWQRIPKAHHDDVTAGVDMPDAENFTLSDPHTTVSGDTDMTSWTFRATLREPSFWSRKYPFDYGLMRLRLMGRPSAVSFALVPDLGAYDWLMPQKLPGVDDSLVLPGWDLDHSYFSYVAQTAKVGAGAPTNLGRVLPYDLAFNVVSQRRFLDPFVSSVLPIIVIACLLFGLLLVGSKNSQKVSATGFKATDVLRASVTLLFPALVAQVNLRSKIGATEIIYIEYFYFILYLAILGVSANALTFTLAVRGVSQVRDNLIPKLFFWPGLLGACFLVTLAFLY